MKVGGRSKAGVYGGTKRKDAALGGEGSAAELMRNAAYISIGKDVKKEDYHHATPLAPFSSSLTNLLSSPLLSSLSSSLLYPGFAVLNSHAFSFTNQALTATSHSFHSIPLNHRQQDPTTMSAILSADDLNDFISPGVACIKPIETLPAQKSEDNSVCSFIYPSRHLP